jgi:hypothetical protein
MSFLSRKPARPGGRGSDAARDDEYDDYDGYAQDGYQNEDDGWSPGQYFSPEGIKGRWAGEQPDGRAGGRGQRDNGRGDARPGYDSYAGDLNAADYASGPGYGADEFATGVYDLPDGADDDRPDRGRRRRRDREDRGERTGILRLRRDRGEDIWPDDGISDEDYWASVAADRPLNGADSPVDKVPGGGSRPAMDPPRPAMDTRPAADARPGIDASRPGAGGADSRFGGEQRGGERSVAGRLGPPPGLAGDYKPGAPGGAGPLGAGSQPGGSRTGSGPMPARPGTGPMPARPGTGPLSVRPGTGPTPTVGVTSSRPPAGQHGMRPGPAQPGTGSSGFQQPAPRPSFKPNGHQAGGGPAAGRPQDRNDWDRTERIDRVNASGYPEPRPSSRSQGPGSSERPGASVPLGAPTGFGPGPSAAPGHAPAPGRARGDSARADSSRSDSGRADWAAPDRREPDRRDPGRNPGREASGPWPAAGRAAAAEDDPLTSKAYSRSALGETDGRSYRVAARRSQAQTQLTEQAETFITGQYQQSSQYQSGRTGEYWQYRDDAPASSTQPPAGRYQGPGGQGPSSQGPANQGHPPQSGRSQASPGQGPGHGGQPGRSNPGRPAPGLPGTGVPTGQYDGQQSRPPQQQRQQPQQRQPSQVQLPGGGLPGASVPTGALPTGSLPAAGPSGGSQAGPAASAPVGARPNGAGGLNPYDSSVTGSYPYPSQPYPARPAPAGPVQDANDDRYYRPAPADGHAAGNAGQGRTDQGRAAYGNGYPPSGDRRY